MLIEKKNIDIHLGMLPDKIIFEVLGQYGIDDSWIAIPFINVNNGAMAINRRSETAKKAVLLHNNKSYVIKEIPWYCSNEDFVQYEVAFQRSLREEGIPIPEIILTKGGNSFVAISNQSKKTFLFLQKYVLGSSWDKSRKHLISSSDMLAKIHLASERISDKIQHKYQPPSTSVFELSKKMIDVVQEVCEEQGKYISHKDRAMLKDFCDVNREIVRKNEVMAIQKGYGDYNIPIHGDYNPWNLVFSSVEEKIVGVVDFDNSVIDNPIHDIAEAILDFCFFTFKNQATRFKNIPTFFDIKNAILFLTKYQNTSEEIFGKTKPYLKEALIAIAIELISLGLVRADYDLSELSSLRRSIEVVQNLNL